MTTLTDVLTEANNVFARHEAARDATSLLYAKIRNRQDRLNRLVKVNAPVVLLSKERRLLNEAIDDYLGKE